MNAPKSYWQDAGVTLGEPTPPADGGIIVIGAGLSGVSAAYWLLEGGVDSVTIVDDNPTKAASFRNCGHILNGTVESPAALLALYGQEKAQEIWQFSLEICQEVQETCRKNQIQCDYRQDGYLVIAIDETELAETHQSVAILDQMGIRTNRIVEAKELHAQGFKTALGGRFEKTSAQAHPGKFRNGLLEVCLAKGAKYHSNSAVKSLTPEGSDYVNLEFSCGTKRRFDAVVIATNAYSPHFSDFYASRRLVEPFRGQLITSRPLTKPLNCALPHSFDHGYIYAIGTPDNRLMIGGWRNNTPAGEIGTYDINPNSSVSEGLKRFVQDHYSIEEEIEWEYDWAGIMATSKTGMPFIGPTNSPLVYTVGGYTGHGFSWAHGSARLLADIMLGRPLPSVAQYFNPCS